MVSSSPSSSPSASPSGNILSTLILAVCALGVTAAVYVANRRRGGGSDGLGSSITGGRHLYGPRGFSRREDEGGAGGAAGSGANASGCVGANTKEALARRYYATRAALHVRQHNTSTLEWSDPQLGVAVLFSPILFATVMEERQAPLVLLKLQYLRQKNHHVSITIEELYEAGEGAEAYREANLVKIADCAKILSTTTARIGSRQHPEAEYCYVDESDQLVYVLSVFVCHERLALTVQYVATGTRVRSILPTAFYELIRSIRFSTPVPTPSYLLVSEPRLGLGFRLPLDFTVHEGAVDSGVEDVTSMGVSRGASPPYSMPSNGLSCFGGSRGTGGGAPLFSGTSISRSRLPSQRQGSEAEDRRGVTSVSFTPFASAVGQGSRRVMVVASYEPTALAVTTTSGVSTSPAGGSASPFLSTFGKTGSPPSPLIGASSGAVVGMIHTGDIGTAAASGAGASRGILAGDASAPDSSGSLGNIALGSQASVVLRGNRTGAVTAGGGRPSMASGSAAGATAVGAVGAGGMSVMGGGEGGSGSSWQQYLERQTSAALQRFGLYLGGSSGNPSHHHSHHPLLSPTQQQQRVIFTDSAAVGGGAGKDKSKASARDPGPGFILMRPFNANCTARGNFAKEEEADDEGERDGGGRRMRLVGSFCFQEARVARGSRTALFLGEEDEEQEEEGTAAPTADAMATSGNSSLKYKHSGGGGGRGQEGIKQVYWAAFYIPIGDECVSFNFIASAARHTSEEFIAFCTTTVQSITLGNHNGQLTSVLYCNYRHEVMPFTLALNPRNEETVEEPQLGDPIAVVHSYTAEHIAVLVRAFPVVIAPVSSSGNNAAGAGAGAGGPLSRQQTAAAAGNASTISQQQQHTALIISAGGANPGSATQAPLLPAASPTSGNASTSINAATPIMGRHATSGSHKAGSGTGTPIQNASTPLSSAVLLTPKMGRLHQQAVIAPRRPPSRGPRRSPTSKAAAKALKSTVRTYLSQLPEGVTVHEWESITLNARPAIRLCFESASATSLLFGTPESQQLTNLGGEDSFMMLDSASVATSEWLSNRAFTLEEEVGSINPFATYYPPPAPPAAYLGVSERQKKKSAKTNAAAEQQQQQQLAISMSSSALEKYSANNMGNRIGNDVLEARNGGVSGHYAVLGTPMDIGARCGDGQLPPSSSSSPYQQLQQEVPEVYVQHERTASHVSRDDANTLRVAVAVYCDGQALVFIAPASAYTIGAVQHAVQHLAAQLTTFPPLSA